MLKSKQINRLTLSGLAAEAVLSMGLQLSCGTLDRDNLPKNEAMESIQLASHEALDSTYQLNSLEIIEKVEFFFLIIERTSPEFQRVFNLKFRNLSLLSSIEKWETIQSTFSSLQNRYRSLDLDSLLELSRTNQLREIENLAFLDTISDFFSYIDSGKLNLTNHEQFVLSSGLIVRYEGTKYNLNQILLENVENEIMLPPISTDYNLSFSLVYKRFLDTERFNRLATAAPSPRTVASFESSNLLFSSVELSSFADQADIIADNNFYWITHLKSILMLFLQDQARQACNLISRQLELIEGSNNYSSSLKLVLRSRIERITMLIESFYNNFKEIDWADLIEHLAYLFELAGGTFSVENGLDSFGNRSRSTYSVEQMIFNNDLPILNGGYIGVLGYAQQEVNGYISTDGIVLTELNRLITERERPTNQQYLELVLDDLNQHGSILNISSSDTAPTLIIFPEIHTNPNIIYENLERLRANYNYLSFIASEGSDLGIIGEYSGYQNMAEAGDTRELFEEYMRENNSGLSSSFLLNNSNYSVYGVDNSSLRSASSSLEITNSYRRDDTQRAILNLPLETQNEIQENFSIFWSYDARYAEQERERYIVDIRSYAWVENIETHLLALPQSEDSSNIVVLTCGFAHVPTISEEAYLNGWNVGVYMSDAWSDAIE